MAGFFLPLFRLSFWFARVGAPFTPWAGRFIVIFLTLLFLLGLFCLMAVQLSQKHRQPWYQWFDKSARHFLNNVATCSFCAFACGVCLYFFTWEQISILSMRFWFLVWAIGFGFWYVWLAIHYFVLLPKQLAEQEERERYEKWLPKPKRK